MSNEAAAFPVVFYLGFTHHKCMCTLCIHHTHTRACIHTPHTHTQIQHHKHQRGRLISYTFLHLSYTKQRPNVQHIPPSIEFCGKDFPVSCSSFVTPHCAVDRILPNSTELCRTTCDSHVSCILELLILCCWYFYHAADSQGGDEGVEEKVALNIHRPTLLPLWLDLLFRCTVHCRTSDVFCFLFEVYFQIQTIGEYLLPDITFCLFIFNCPSLNV